MSTQRARELRANMTEAERRLWRSLRARGLGVKFRRQVPVGRYIADFLCVQKRLIVEVDGSQHFENTYDAVRDGFLNAAGYKVLRFWNNEVLQNTEGVLQVIKRELEKR
jgi:very-short-patch-repair endonuclease